MSVVDRHGVHNPINLSSGFLISSVLAYLRDASLSDKALLQARQRILFLYENIISSVNMQIETIETLSIAPIIPKRIFFFLFFLLIF